MQFIKEKSIGQINDVILFASYEERSVCIAHELAKLGYGGSVKVFYCEDLSTPQIQDNLGTIESILSRNVQKIPVSYNNPIPMVKAAREMPRSDSILIDISCFNRGNLFPFLWSSGLGRECFINITFAYSPPENYGDWLSRDYEDPCNIIGFAGGLDFPKDRFLVCVVGYEVERALKVIAAAEPSQVFLTVGSKPTRVEFYERNRTAVERVLGSNNFEIQEIDVSDPNATLKDLCDIIKNITPGTAIDIAPFSTKLSCLGIWALWMQNKNIRIWNAQPKTYNLLNYSKGSTPPRYFSVEW